MRIPGYFFSYLFLIFFSTLSIAKADAIRLISPDAALQANIIVTADNINFLQYTIDRKKIQEIPSVSLPSKIFTALGALQAIKAAKKRSRLKLPLWVSPMRLLVNI
jgi:hypothetical protein